MSDEAHRSGPPAQPAGAANQPGWALPDSDLRPVPVAPPQPAQPPPWPPAAPPGRRPMPTWAKVVLGLGIAYYVLAVLAGIAGFVVIYYFLESRG